MELAVKNPAQPFIPASKQAAQNQPTQAESFDEVDAMQS